MPTGRDDVCFREKTGSYAQTVKMSRMTQSGHSARFIIADGIVRDVATSGAMRFTNPCAAPAVDPLRWRMPWRVLPSLTSNLVEVHDALH
jgi:hypothetical protein